MLVSMCYLHWQTKKTVLEVSLERNQTDSKERTLKPIQHCGSTSGSSSPCLFVCFVAFPLQNIVTSPSLPFPLLLFFSRLFPPSLPSFFFFLSSLSSAFGSPRRSPPSQLREPAAAEATRQRGARPARRPAEKGSLTVPIKSSASSFPPLSSRSEQRPRSKTKATTCSRSLVFFFFFFS